MAVSDAQRRASARYHKKMKQIAIRFSPNEADIYEHAQAQQNTAGYIKRLIREDMERNG